MKLKIKDLGSGTSLRWVGRSFCANNLGRPLKENIWGTRRMQNHLLHRAHSCRHALYLWLPSNTFSLFITLIDCFNRPIRINTAGPDWVTEIGKTQHCTWDLEKCWSVGYILREAATEKGESFDGCVSRRGYRAHPNSVCTGPHLWVF